MKNIQVLLSLFVLLFSLTTKAQNTTSSVLHPKWAVVLNAGHQEDGVNVNLGALQTIHKVFLRPYISAGVERTWVNRSRFRLFQDVKLSYFHDIYVERVMGLGTDVGFEFKIFKGLRITPRLGIAYNSAKATDVRYTYEGEKWVKIVNPDPSINRTRYMGGLDLSYRFNNKFDMLVGGHFAAVTPYLPQADFGFYLHKGVHIGTRFFF